MSFEGSFRGFSEQARTRGLSSLSFGRFGFVVDCCASFIRLVARSFLIVNVIGLLQATGNVGVRLEFRQHTNVPGNGFFTLIDDVDVDP